MMRQAAIAAWVVVFAISATVAYAAQTNGQFNVTVNLQPASIQTGFCTKEPGRNTAGAMVMVVCSSGSIVDLEAPRNAVPWVPIHGGAYRYNLLTMDELSGMSFQGGIDSYTGMGTATTWRIINLPDREYIEMLIGW